MQTRMSLSGKGEYRRFQNLKSNLGRQQPNSHRSNRSWEQIDRSLLNFIWAQNEWVDKEVLERLNIRDPSAVDIALNQIHLRTLNDRLALGGKHFDSKRKFSEVLLDQSKQESTWERVPFKAELKKEKLNRKPEQVATIFLHSIPEEATSREIWQLFNHCGEILDIILPRKRDKKGIRYGFVQTKSELEAGAIISNAKASRGLGRKIKMSINSSTRPDKKEVSSKKTSDVKVLKTESKSAEDCEFQKKMFEFIEVEVDEEVEEALLDCKIGFTWFDMGVNTLQEIFNDMGLHKYRIISLSKRKFLIRKDKNDKWEDLDSTDLSVWFCKIRRYEEADHVISRVIWLECRGLPMPAWKEENLKAFTARLGEWISWSYQSDGLGEFFNPVICIDTVEWDKIQENMKILYKGKQIHISFTEVSDINKLDGKIMPMELSEELKNNSVSEDMKNVAESEVKTQKQTKKEGGVLVLGDAKTMDEVVTSHVDQISDVSQKITSKVGTDNVEIKAPIEVGMVETGQINHDIRKVQSSSEIVPEDTLGPEISAKSAVGSEKSVEVLDNSHSTLCAGISKKLRVKSTRGRPRKKSFQQRNPFEIGSKCRIRSNKRIGSRSSQQKQMRKDLIPSQIVIPPRVVGGTVKEALEILASAEYMGLEIIGDREVVVQELVRRLDRREL
ncbi:hypothetical protein ACET3Z_009410 [Daucus carota]